MFLLFLFLIYGFFARDFPFLANHPKNCIVGRQCGNKDIIYVLAFNVNSCDSNGGTCIQIAGDSGRKISKRFWSAIIKNPDSSHFIAFYGKIKYQES